MTLEIEDRVITEEINGKKITSKMILFGRCLCCGLPFGIKISDIPKNKKLIQYGCFDVIATYMNEICEDNDCSNCQKINSERCKEQLEIEEYLWNLIQTNKDTFRIWYILNPTSNISRKILKRLYNLRIEEKAIISHALIETYNREDILFDIHKLSNEKILDFPEIENDIASIPNCFFESH